MNFIPDSRNLGGRKAIYDILSNHYSKLDSVKPVLQTRESPQISSPKNRTPKNQDRRFASRHESFSKSDIHRAKGKLNKTLMYEHQVNIKHMQRRIHDIGSVIPKQLNERKKNQFDPISNPVMFFREDPENAPGLPVGCIQKLLKPPKSNKIYKNNLKNLEIYRKTLTPVAGGKESESVELVKNRIFQDIVDKRIYKDQDLDYYFGKAKKAFCMYKAKVVDNAISQIKRDFDC